MNPHSTGVSVMALSCIVSDIKRNIHYLYDFSYLILHNDLLQKTVANNIFWCCFLTTKPDTLSGRINRLCLFTAQACYRQTDRQTDRKSTSVAERYSTLANTRFWCLSVYKFYSLFLFSKTHARHRALAGQYCFNDLEILPESCLALQFWDSLMPPSSKFFWSTIFVYMHLTQHRSKMSTICYTSVQILSSSAKDYSKCIPYNHIAVKYQHHTAQLCQDEQPRPPDLHVYN